MPSELDEVVLQTVMFGTAQVCRNHAFLFFPLICAIKYAAGNPHDTPILTIFSTDKQVDLWSTEVRLVQAVFGRGERPNVVQGRQLNHSTCAHVIGILDEGDLLLRLKQFDSGQTSG